MLCESVKTGTTAETYDVNQLDKIRNKNSVLTGDESRNLNQPSLNRKEIVDTNKNCLVLKQNLLSILLNRITRYINTTSRKIM